MKKCRRYGFSLVELSIVLVIIGLLVGGILVGRSLVRAAELRNVASEYQRYVTATHAFRDKYFALPGDFADGTRIWGRMQSTDCVTNSSAAVIATGVCDGDSSSAISVASTASLPGETHQYWRQLTAAGLIEGTYTGIAGTGSGTQTLPGINAPMSKISNAGWGLKNVGTVTSSSFYFSGYYGHTLHFGRQHSSGAMETEVLRPEETWNIDVKVDDAMPANGKMTVRVQGDSCAVTPAGVASVSTDLDSVYNLDNTNITCTLYFRNAF